MTIPFMEYISYYSIIGRQCQLLCPKGKQKVWITRRGENRGVRAEIGIKWESQGGKWHDFVKFVQYAKM